MDRFITFLAKLLYENRLRQEVAEDIEQHEREAGSFTAARYTRGNVAIQQGRINDKALYN